MQSALAMTRWPLSSYDNADVLTSALEKAHSFLFALAVQLLMSSDYVSADDGLGTETFIVQAMTVVRPLAVAIEVSLGIIVCLVLALLSLSVKRPSELLRDPASIQDVMVMIVPGDAGPTNIRRLSGDECNKFVKLEGGVLDHIPRLRSKGTKRNTKMRECCPKDHTMPSEHEHQCQNSPKRPWELTTAM